ncbi:adenosine kinase [Moniliophthora roreri]|nr:adenosine kinase [Moniliophthora roreri]
MDRILKIEPSTRSLFLSQERLIKMTTLPTSSQRISRKYTLPKISSSRITSAEPVCVTVVRKSEMSFRHLVLTDAVRTV